ncbi:CPBP family intramembrane glutamic endopeptidase [Saxibacter everestensis]|uniref:CPBP family intramembrane glutamic endopeptidase n=1 Tax=Saxibacter everestensis TaxID=2909229 RepID=UPI003D80A692
MQDSEGTRATPDPDAAGSRLPSGAAGPGSPSGAAGPAEPDDSLTPEGRLVPKGRRRYQWEVLLVLGVSLGQSAVYAVVSLLNKLTTGPLAEQEARINVSQSERQYFDLTYQLLGIGFALVPVLLALYFLSASGRGALRRMGLDLSRPWRDLGVGIGLLALIGLPTLGMYAAGSALGLTAKVVPNALNTYWWTVPVLILAAIKNGLLEEILMVGYLMDRLPRFGWPMVTVVLSTALLRGSYHLYQGIGPFIGNVLLGILFSLFYLKYRRVMPLVIAHSLIDIVGFLAPAVLTILPGLFAR